MTPRLLKRPGKSRTQGRFDLLGVGFKFKFSPRPTDSDRQGAAHRPTQAGAHSSTSLEADPAPFGSNHAPPGPC